MLEPGALSITYRRLIAGEGPDQDDETDGSDREDEKGSDRGNMSAGHKTGLAKVPNVINWLSHVLGEGTNSRYNIL